jgi:hypothetical protein
VPKAFCRASWSGTLDIPVGSALTRNYSSSAQVMPCPRGRVDSTAAAQNSMACKLPQGVSTIIILRITKRGLGTELTSLTVRNEKHFKATFSQRTPEDPTQGRSTVRKLPQIRQQNASDHQAIPKTKASAAPLRVVKMPTNLSK